MGNRQPQRSVTTIVFLSCECKRVLANNPRIGQPYYCNLHKKQVTITKLELEYRIRCLDCKYARAFGVARLTAVNKASVHSIRMRGHFVEVWYGDELIDTIGTQNEYPRRHIRTPPLVRKSQVVSLECENPRSQKSGTGGEGTQLMLSVDDSGPNRGIEKDQNGSYSPKFLSP